MIRFALKGPGGVIRERTGPRRLVAPVLAGVLLIACSGSSDEAKKAAVSSSTTTRTTTATTTATTATTATSGTATGASEAAVPSTVAYQFDPATLQCSPTLTPAIARNWQVAAPRTAQAAGNTDSIGLRNKMEGPTAMEAAGGVTGDPSWALPAPDVSLSARVTTPDGATYESRTLGLLPTPPTSWINLAYPGDFPNAPAPTAGTYTVLWISPSGELACDGFTIT